MSAHGTVQRGGWVLVVIGAVVAAASIAFFWLNRPQWGYCVDGQDFGFCDVGVFSANAIVGSVLLGAALIGLVVAVAISRGAYRTRTVLIVSGAFVAALIVAWMLQDAQLEAVPDPAPPHVSESR
jgi:hypothetical protein